MSWNFNKIPFDIDQKNRPQFMHSFASCVRMQEKKEQIRTADDSPQCPSRSESSWAGTSNSGPKFHHVPSLKLTYPLKICRNPKRTFHLPSINFQVKNRYFQVKKVFSKPISILYSVHFLCLLSIWRALLRSQRQDSVSTVKAWHAKTTSVSLSKPLLGGFNPWINASIISPICGLKLQARIYLYWKKNKAPNSIAKWTRKHTPSTHLSTSNQTSSVFYGSIEPGGPMLQEFNGEILSSDWTGAVWGWRKWRCFKMFITRWDP